MKKFLAICLALLLNSGCVTMWYAYNHPSYGGLFNNEEERVEFLKALDKGEAKIIIEKGEK